MMKNLFFLCLLPLLAISATTHALDTQVAIPPNDIQQLGVKLTLPLISQTKTLPTNWPAQSRILTAGPISSKCKSYIDTAKASDVKATSARLRANGINFPAQAEAALETMVKYSSSKSAYKSLKLSLNGSTRKGMMETLVIATAPLTHSNTTGEVGFMVTHGGATVSLKALTCPVNQHYCHRCWFSKCCHDKIVYQSCADTPAQLSIIAKALAASTYQKCEPLVEKPTSLPHGPSQAVGAAPRPFLALPSHADWQITAVKPKQLIARALSTPSAIRELSANYTNPVLQVIQGSVRAIKSSAQTMFLDSVAVADAPSAVKDIIDAQSPSKKNREWLEWINNVSGFSHFDGPVTVQKLTWLNDTKSGMINLHIATALFVPSANDKTMCSIFIGTADAKVRPAINHRPVEHHDDDSLMATATLLQTTPSPTVLFGAADVKADGHFSNRQVKFASDDRTGSTTEASVALDLTLFAVWTSALTGEQFSPMMPSAVLPGPREQALTYLLTRYMMAPAILNSTPLAIPGAPVPTPGPGAWLKSLGEGLDAVAKGAGNLVKALGSSSSTKIKMFSKLGLDKLYLDSRTLFLTGVPLADIPDMADAAGTAMGVPAKYMAGVKVMKYSRMGPAEWKAQQYFFTNSGSSNAQVFVVLKNFDPATKMANYLFVYWNTKYDIAPDIEVITNKKKILGGLWESEKDTIKKVPHVITPKDINTLLALFWGLAAGDVSTWLKQQGNMTALSIGEGMTGEGPSAPRDNGLVNPTPSTSPRKSSRTEFVMVSIGAVVACALVAVVAFIIGKRQGARLHNYRSGSEPLTTVTA